MRPKPLRETRFVLDGHLGKLARGLRLLGFDVVWRRNPDDAELARISRDERRILLTRDQGLLKRKAVTHGSFVRDTDPRRQLLDVVKQLHLERQARPFTRCLACNAKLREATREEVDERAPERVRERYERFQCCDGCSRVFWPGTHYRRMRELAAEALGAGRRCGSGASPQGTGPEVSA